MSIIGIMTLPASKQVYLKNIANQKTKMEDNNLKEDITYGLFYMVNMFHTSVRKAFSQYIYQLALAYPFQRNTCSGEHKPGREITFGISN